MTVEKTNFEQNESAQRLNILHLEILGINLLLAQKAEEQSRIAILSVADSSIKKLYEREEYRRSLESFTFGTPDPTAREEFTDDKKKEQLWVLLCRVNRYKGNASIGIVEDIFNLLPEGSDLAKEVAELIEKVSNSRHLIKVIRLPESLKRSLLDHTRATMLESLISEVRESEVLPYAVLGDIRSCLPPPQSNNITTPEQAAIDSLDSKFTERRVLFGQEGYYPIYAGKYSDAINILSETLQRVKAAKSGTPPLGSYVTKITLSRSSASQSAVALPW